MKRLSPVGSKRPPLKKARESAEIDLPEVALAAVVSFKKQKEVTEFINFMLQALERNSSWLNAVVDKQEKFRCALLVGAGPNRFQLQEIIYPCGEDDIKLEVEMRDSEDYDKVAIAAILQLSNLEIDGLSRYIKTRMIENIILREDLIQGKSLGISFAVLRPISQKQYRVMERIVIGSPSKCVVAAKKRPRVEKLASGPLVKKTRKVVYT